MLVDGLVREQALGVEEVDAGSVDADEDDPLLGEPGDDAAKSSFQSSGSGNVPVLNNTRGASMGTRTCFGVMASPRFTLTSTTWQGP